MTTSVVVFSAAFVNRYWLSGFLFGPWYFADEALDGCIAPFQFLQGEPIWAGNSNDLVYLTYLLAYRLFGFSPDVARSINILSFATSILIFYWALERPFGRQAGWFVLGMMFLASPFITHSIYATAISFSLLPTSLTLFILTRVPNQVLVALLGPILASGLFIYPGAFLTGVCLTLFHAVFFYRNWTWKARSIALASFILSGGSAYTMHRLGGHSWRQWAGGHLSFEGIGQPILVMLKDAFWESVSFNSLNSGAPYLDTVMMGFLIIGGVSSLIFSKSQLSMFDRKWVWIGLLSFLGSVVLSALGGPYPGVRRIFASLPLLFLIAGLGLKYLRQWEAFRLVLVATIIVCFGLVTSRSYSISRKEWHRFRYFSRKPDFMVAAGQMLVQSTNNQKTVVIVGYNSDQWRGQLYRCALSLDEELNQHFQKVIVLPRSELNQRKDVKGEFLLLANELFSDTQLQDIFGSPPSSSKIRKFSASPQPRDLVAIYEFMPDSLSGAERGHT